MNESKVTVLIRPLDELDLGDVCAIDERIGGAYRPDVWERRVTYHLRRDPESAFAAEAEGRVVGFVLGDIRSGEFGLEEKTGWIEVLGVDPNFRGHGIGHRLGEAILAAFRERGAVVVRTLVDEKQAELGTFFTSLGFEPAPIRPFVKTL